MFKIKPLVSGVMVSFAVFFIIISMFAMVSLKIGVMMDEVYFWFSLITLGFSTFSGGFISGKAAGEKVLIYGFFVSLISSLIFALFAFLIFKSDFSSFIIKFALIIIATVTGSVVSTIIGKKSRYV